MLENNLVLNDNKTMSSVELVKIINDMRDEGKPVLRHSHFMDRIDRVSNEVGIPFQRHTHINEQNNQSYPCALLCLRLAKLMTMTESVKVQLAVLDRVTELENANNNKLPSNYIEALSLLIESEKAKEALRLENTKLTVLLDREFGYVSIIRASLYAGVHEKHFDWRVLKTYTIGLGMEVKKVPSPRFGYMLLYPIKAFQACYSDIDFDDLTPENVEDKELLIIK